MGNLREHLRRHAVGYVGVFLALTGTAAALPGTDSVDSGDIINGQVKTPDLASNAVTSPKIADNSVVSADLRDGGVARVDLANNSVNSAKVLDGSLGAVDVNANQIQQRVTGGCPAPKGISSIAADGGVTCSTPVFGIRLFPDAGFNNFIDFTSSGPGLALGTSCHIGAITLVLITNHGPQEAAINWFLNSNGTVTANGAAIPPGGDFPFELDGKRIEGQIIFIDETGVSTINLHAADGGAACETIGTLQWAPS